MTRHVFYPYRAAIGEVELSAEGLSPAVTPTDDLVLRLFEYEQDVYRVRFAVSVEDHLLKRVLPEEELADPPVTLVLFALGVQSHTRTSWNLGPPTADGTSIEVTLPRADYAGILDFEAALVRTVPRTDMDRYAGEANLRLATSPRVRVEFDEPQSPPGRSIDVEWIDFREEPGLSRHPSSLFSLALSDGRPRILLNTAVERAVPVLTSNARTGARARVRDATFHLVVHQVWTSLLGHAAAALGAVVARTEPVPDPDVGWEEVLAELMDWQQQVLRDWAPHLYWEVSRGDALDHLIEGALDGTLSELITERLPHAIQDRFGTTKGFSGLVNQLDL